MQKTHILLTLMPGSRAMSMSAMAYAAFPDFKFSSPQGAALCISRTVHDLLDDGLVRMQDYGYQITEQGIALVVATSEAGGRDA